MDRVEFSEIRRLLGKSQRQIADLLAMSAKAVQSFEQGWRNIPVHVERQMLFLMAMKKSQMGGSKPCWDIQCCPTETKERCPAWEFQSGHLCWFINGTVCQGEVHKSWTSKMKTCRSCKVFHSMLTL